MLQQTQVKTVIPFWERWLRELPTIAAAAQAPSAKLHKLWEGLGYYTRVRNLQKAAQVIMEKHAGQFPENFDDVLALPGIGPYTAGAICSIAFNQPTPILDGNVIRVLTRLFGIAENPKEKQTNARLWRLAEELVCRATAAKAAKEKSASQPSRSSRDTGSCSRLNQSLMELGALICTPRKPQCLICPVKKLCRAFKENRTETLPNLGKREAATARRFIAFVIEHKGKFLVRQRPVGIVNAHLWEFLNVEVAAGGPPGGKRAGHFKRASISRKIPGGGTPAATLVSAAKKLGLEFHGSQPLCTVKHSITRYRITLEAFIVRLETIPVTTGGVWKTPAQLQPLAFSAAHKKLATAAAQSILSGR